MTSPRFAATVLFAALAAIMPGCVKPIVVDAFDGPDRADAEIATLQFDAKLRLTQLDGRPVAGLPAGFDENDPLNPRVIRLLPGRHELLVGKRPYIQTHTHNMYTYLPSGGDCHGGMRQIWIGSYTTTTHVAGSREDERIMFDVSAGRRYRVNLDDPLDWFSRRDRWRVTVIEKTDGWRDTVVSTSVGRQRHVRPDAAAAEIELARHSETRSPPPP